MRLLSVALAVGAIVAACGGDGAPDPEGSPAQVIENTLETMDELDSYRMIIEVSSEDRSRISLADYDSGAYYELIPAEPDDGQLQLVTAERYAYTRECSDPPGDCEQWERVEWLAAVPSIAGTAGGAEILPFTILELGSGWTLEEDGDNWRLTGRVNVPSAVNENIRRLVEISGFSDEEAGRLLNSLKSPTPSLNYDPFSDVIVDIEPETSRLMRVTFNIPDDLPELVNTTFDYTFSHYDQIVVEVPTDFVDAEEFE